MVTQAKKNTIFGYRKVFKRIRLETIVVQMWVFPLLFFSRFGGFFNTFYVQFNKSFKTAKVLNSL